MNKITVHHAKLYPLKIRLRERLAFAHVQYDESRPVVIAVELQNGVVGYGEAISDQGMDPHQGDEIFRHLETTYIPLLLDFHPESFGDALEAIENLPMADPQNRAMICARSAMECALLDATLQSYQRTMDDVVRWMGMPGFGLPGSVGRALCVGVLSYENVRITQRYLRKLYWRGVREYKLMIREKDEVNDWSNLFAYLNKPLLHGGATLCLDFQGMWPADQVRACLKSMYNRPVTSIEQPLRVDDGDLWLEFSEQFQGTLVHDESIVSLEDAKQLTDRGIAQAFNLRIGKCGGLLPTLRIASHARKNGTRIILGTTPGETSLSIRWNLELLNVCPGISFVEDFGWNGLLHEDLTTRKIGYRFSGRPLILQCQPTNLKISPHHLQSLVADESFVYNF